MSILAALFAVSLSLTSPSQYTFTSNLFDSSFFTGTGYGNTESPPYRTLRLEDAAFLTESFWERCSAFYISDGSQWCEQFSISGACFSNNSTNQFGIERSPGSAIGTALVFCGATTTNSALYDSFVFKSHTNAICNSFFCASTSDALPVGYHNNVGMNGEYYVGGVSTVGNIRPLISQSVQYDYTIFPTNIWNYRYFLAPQPFFEDYIRSCYQLLGSIRSGVEKMGVGTYDFLSWSSLRWMISYTANAWTEYTYTYTDEHGNERTIRSSYPSGYSTEELDYPGYGSYSNHVSDTYHLLPNPHILRYRTTARRYAKRYNSYSEGQEQTYNVIDNGYGDTQIYSENRNSANASSTIQFHLDDYSGFKTAYPRGTRFGSLRVFFVSRGTARTIHTQSYLTQYEHYYTNAVTVTTNATPFVNVSKATATLTVDGDNMKIEFPGSVLAMASDAVEANEHIFANMPQPASLEPTNLGGMTLTDVHYDPTSTAEDRYLAEIVYDTIECYIQSSPTYHARVL